MRSFLCCIVFIAFCVSCDEERVFEKNIDFNSRNWLVSDKPEFEFEIADTLLSYNLYCNIRNSVAYPFSRIFVTYYLMDSTGVPLEKRLVTQMLFDDTTGEPHGNSGLGDLYDHRIPLKKDYRFQRSGKYKVRFEQYMRKDTLSGIIAVGLRVEKAVAD
jgi:gliding motility-associated lipoprotein GldH